MYNENEMYLMITDLQEGDKDKINNFLKENNFEAKEFATPMAMFCWEEASFRLQLICKDDISIEEKEKFSNKYRDELSSFLYEDDIIDGDYVSYLTDDFVINNVKSNEVEEYIWDAKYILERKEFLRNNGAEVE